MKNLTESLREILPRKLGKNPRAAVNGTELLQRIPSVLRKEYSEQSIRQCFSNLAKDPSSPIARVSTGHGYYLSPEWKSPDRTKDSPNVEPDSPARKRDRQLEEKFREIFLKYQKSQGLYPARIEHTKAKSTVRGRDQWKHPDVVVLEWTTVSAQDDVEMLDAEMLAVQHGTGASSFRLESVELKVEATLSTVRENFFQCVSNSKWAHTASLVFAAEIADDHAKNELQRLSASYGVAVSSLGISKERLEELPSAGELRGMSLGDFEKRYPELWTVQQVGAASPRSDLDWDHVMDLYKLGGDFARAFQWISKCLADKRMIDFDGFCAGPLRMGESGNDFYGLQPARSLGA